MTWQSSIAARSQWTALVVAALDSVRMPAAWRETALDGLFSLRAPEPVTVRRRAGAAATGPVPDPSDRRTRAQSASST
jgi:hypothetical protein